MTIQGSDLPGGSISVLYIEDYCRPGSTDRAWGETTVGHKTRLVSASRDGRKIELACTLSDGVTVKHTITATDDEVDFRLVVHNPTEKPSKTHWAQPCMRVGRFTGTAKDPKFDGTERPLYLGKSFIFLDGKLARMPTAPCATKARYVYGQVWCPKNVDRDDVNPRPLSKLVPSNGLIGCFSADEKKILAMAWEPYQELFQGVITCLHSDFRIGGLAPGETKKVRGKIYIVPAGVEALVKRYERDFPEQAAAN